MTLLELIVALTVVGTAVSAGFGALSMLADRRDVLEATSTATAHATATRGSIIEWLNGASLDPVRVGASFQGLDHLHETLPDDRLTFLTLASTPLEVDRTLVTLRIARDSAGIAKGLVADLRDWDSARSRTLVLASDAVTFDVRYLSSLRSDDSWAPSWITGSMLPRGVELRITARDGQALDPILALPIIVAFEGAR